jgi:hypothetical protein
MGRPKPSNLRIFEDQLQPERLDKGYRRMVEKYPERVPLTQRTFNRLPKDMQRFYWNRRFELRPTELAARCMIVGLRQKKARRPCSSHASSDR